VPSIDQQQLERPLQQVVVGSKRGAVRTSRSARFLAPPSEPDVRIAPHPALPVSMPVGYPVAGSAVVAHGDGIAVPR
jgi:hypothetical protein